LRRRKAATMASTAPPRHRGCVTPLVGIISLAISIYLFQSEGISTGSVLLGSLAIVLGLVWLIGTPGPVPPAPTATQNLTRSPEARAQTPIQVQYYETGLRGGDWNIILNRIEENNEWAIIRQHQEGDFAVWADGHSYDTRPTRAEAEASLRNAIQRYREGKPI
jgi:hypothetical protein